MRYIQADGLRVSAIGLGTWQFGSREWGYGEAYASEVAPALVRRALELGITMLDTAEMYGFGRSERIIRGALAEVPEADRAGLTVATKLMPIVPAEPIVAWQAAGSRRRLGVDVLDLYYLHWPNPIASARRTMQAVRPLLRSGVVRRIGVSNYSLDRWRESERALRSPLIANQVRFSLVSPGPAADLVPYAAERGRLVVAYSPLGQGLLARVGESDEPLPGFRAANQRFNARGRRGIEPLAAAVREIADDHAATPAQVALAWVIHHPNTVAIPGARTVAQLEENAAAADLVLSDDELTRLSSEATAFAGSRRGR
jgi:aryl-alcohol dehydrogenase-like predicted oxidoreductase